MLHPNLPALYSRTVATLGEAIRDPTAAATAAEVWRSLIDAIMVYPGERRGKVRVELRADLAAFLHLEGRGDISDARAAIPQMGNGRSGEVMGSLVAGEDLNLRPSGYEPDLSALRTPLQQKPLPQHVHPELRRLPASFRAPR